MIRNRFLNSTGTGPQKPGGSSAFVVESLPEAEKDVQYTATRACGPGGVFPELPAGAFLPSGRVKRDKPVPSRWSAVRVKQVRIGVVVGSGVSEARFDDEFGRRVGAGYDADALLP